MKPLLDNLKSIFILNCVISLTLIFPLAASAGFSIEKINANPAKGFEWAYYLAIPDQPCPNTVLMVQPNNSGKASDDDSFHDQKAREYCNSRAQIFTKTLKVPLLVPTFSRPEKIWQVYTQALDRDTVLTSEPKFIRLDLQLLAMIADARDRLSSRSIITDEKVFVNGFSADAMFANRFTAIHPNRIKAAAIGAPGGWPLAPVSTWNGESLNYHIGVADFAQIIGKPFDQGTFSSVPQYFYLGDQDTNDSVPNEDSYSAEQRQQVERLFGTAPVERWEHAKEIYSSIGASAQFVTYPGVGHETTTGIWSDLVDFFRSYLPECEDSPDIDFSAFFGYFHLTWNLPGCPDTPDNTYLTIGDDINKIAYDYLVLPKQGNSITYRIFTSINWYNESTVSVIGRKITVEQVFYYHNGTPNGDYFITYFDFAEDYNSFEINGKLNDYDMYNCFSDVTGNGTRIN